MPMGNGRRTIERQPILFKKLQVLRILHASRSPGRDVSQDAPRPTPLRRVGGAVGGLGQAREPIPQPRQCLASTFAAGAGPQNTFEIENLDQHAHLCVVALPFARQRFLDLGLFAQRRDAGRFGGHVAQSSEVCDDRC
jgi:hypothetical protein